MLTYVNTTTAIEGKSIAPENRQGQRPVPVSVKLPNINHKLSPLIWASQFNGDSLYGAVDLHPYRFGLTSPPRAVTLVPNAKIRNPSFLMLMAAFTSRSCRCPQCVQSNSRTDRAIFAMGSKVFEHRCVQGKNLPTSR
jgi:hypothetical protein